MVWVIIILYIDTQDILFLLSHWFMLWGPVLFLLLVYYILFIMGPVFFIICFFVFYIMCFLLLFVLL